MWIIRFLFESIGDYQKHKFKSNSENKGKIIKSGLWKYTRHPNYFGEALLWWGIYLIIINQVPYYLSFFGPLLLNFLLLKVSEVLVLEKNMTPILSINNTKNQLALLFLSFQKQEMKVNRLHTNTAYSQLLDFLLLYIFLSFCQRK